MWEYRTLINWSTISIELLQWSTVDLCFVVCFVVNEESVKHEPASTNSNRCKTNAISDDYISANK